MASNRWLWFAVVAEVTIVSACLTPVPAAGQVAKASLKPTALRRLADGHPDLEGTYDLATLTPLERPRGAKAVLTPEEAAALEKAAAGRRDKANEAISGDRSAPPKGGDGSSGPAGGVGGYNYFWLDPGSRYSVVGGEMEPPGSYDDPERRPLGERCLLGFGSTSGPPALPDYFYNNLHQIVQTPEAIMILTEMVHDARIVRIGAEHLPKTIRRWMGDSVGHWEGDTLVVDTTNFNDQTRFRGSTKNLHVVERFSRVDDKTLLYRFTIEDPDTWDRPWTGEYTWPATDQPIYEYACHEANYALGDILRGARTREAEAAARTSK